MLGVNVLMKYGPDTGIGATITGETKIGMGS
jgi:hypothetical protein